MQLLLCVGFIMKSIFKNVVKVRTICVSTEIKMSINNLKTDVLKMEQNFYGTCTVSTCSFTKLKMQIVNFCDS